MGDVERQQLYLSLLYMSQKAKQHIQSSSTLAVSRMSVDKWSEMSSQYSRWEERACTEATVRKPWFC